MNKRMLIAAMSVAIIGVTGCSTTRTDLTGGAQINPGESAGTAIADQRLASSEFKRQGVRIIYSFTGNVEAIETTGYARSLGQQHECRKRKLSCGRAGSQKKSQ
jgi:hypothetical protein